MSDTSKPVAVVTGASSGIGEATARQLTESGFYVVLGARRMDRLDVLASDIGGRAIYLDVANEQSVTDFANQVDSVQVLVNNAGGAVGLATVSEASAQHWQTMFNTNVLGLMMVTRAFIPKLIASQNGHIINIGSVAALESYPKGAGYTAAKHGARAVTTTLRQELIGQPVRITEIDPGLVETEFSIVRFDGDEEKAKKVYEGMTPLVAHDVAEAVVWCVSRPAHVNIDQLVIKPRDQVSAQVVNRRTV